MQLAMSSKGANEGCREAGGRARHADDSEVLIDHDDSTPGAKELDESKMARYYCTA